MDESDSRFIVQPASYLGMKIISSAEKVSVGVSDM